jgi:hypothetical protein
MSVPVEGYSTLGSSSNIGYSYLAEKCRLLLNWRQIWDKGILGENEV